MVLSAILYICPAGCACACPDHACVALPLMQWPAPFQWPCVAAPSLNNQDHDGLYFSKTSRGQRHCQLGTAAAGALPPGATTAHPCCRQLRRTGLQQLLQLRYSWLGQVIDGNVDVNELENDQKQKGIKAVFSNSMTLSYSSLRLVLLGKS